MPYSQVTFLLFLTSLMRLVSGGYEFEYGVNSPATGDVKDHREVRQGGQVTGYYRVLDADGLMRTVNYRSDPLTGFQADVRREPLAVVAARPTAVGATLLPQTKEITYATAVPTVAQRYSGAELYGSGMYGGAGLYGNGMYGAGLYGNGLYQQRAVYPMATSYQKKSAWKDATAAYVAYPYDVVASSYRYGDIDGYGNLGYSDNFNYWYKK